MTYTVWVFTNNKVDPEVFRTKHGAMNAVCEWMQVATEVELREKFTDRIFEADNVFQVEDYCTILETQVQP